MMDSKTKNRIVAAVIHQKSKEVEIIIETTTNVGSLNEKETLDSLWINCELELAKRGE